MYHSMCVVMCVYEDPQKVRLLRGPMGLASE